MTRPTLLFRGIALASDVLGKPTEAVQVAVAREGLRALMRTSVLISGRRPPLASVVDEVLAGVVVRRYVPLRAKPGVVVFAHGGGWVVGDLETHDIACAQLAAASEREVVAVHYRRAPEHRFPAAVDDVVTVTGALISRGVVVAGDSAGGNLAAVAAQHFGSALRGQLLVYPVVECEDESPSYTRYAKGFLLSRETMRYYRRTYAPTDAERRDPRCSPARATDVTGLAPAFVLLAECDVLHDEGWAYAQRLTAAGVPTTTHVERGAVHGFFSLQGLPPSRRAMAKAAAWVAERLATVERA